MADTILVDKTLSQSQQYRLLVEQVKSLLNKNDNVLSNLSNLTAALKQTFEKISWVGFYLFDGDKLYLGPFQGKIACTQIEIGKGVCGTAAKNQETIIVEDVELFPGHIACDADSRSEIVVPVFRNKKLYGVLDLDSNDLSAFDDIDKKYLEEICDFLGKEILN